MRKLNFLYEMQLRFSGNITKHSFALRCMPKATVNQRLLKVSCEISPINSITKSIDAFGNILYSGYIEEPHDYFGFRLSGTVLTNSENIDTGGLNRLFCYPTPQTTITYGAEKYLAEAEKMRDPIQKALAMSSMLYSNFCYRPGTTNTATTAQQALDQGCGVCQDYAHILTALCRSCGIPAHYIAGFMIGEGATHAWAEIYARGKWIGIDPTNNRLVDDQYIKLSEGRDAGDCIIDKGVFFGDVRQDQEVCVKVTEETI